jgi:hypothetical protein
VPLIAERLGASGDDAGAIAVRIGEKRTHVVLDNLERSCPAQPGRSPSCSLPLRRFGDSRAVHALIRRLDGLPLAIELAAARVKLLGPEQLVERIAPRLDLLKGGRDAEERHATLRTTIAWSYDLLNHDELEPRHAGVAPRQEPRPPPHRVRKQTEGASRLEPLLARAPDADSELRAHALRALGGALQISGEPDRAILAAAELAVVAAAAGLERAPGG